MEKAKLINIRRSKKGKMVGTVKFIDGKTMQIPAGALFDESLNDSECEVERDVTGSIILIMVNGKEIYKTAKSVTRGKKETVRQKVRVGNHDSRRTTFQTAATSSAQEATAHAPYNFIPLNKIVVPGQERPDFTRYYKEDDGNSLRRFNGYIDCQLRTITPLYIRDTYTTEELNNKDNNQDNPDFFSPAGSVRIPGSSLRGMTRALVEIMSWGKFGFYDKKQRLFFRAVGDKSSLGNYYRAIMLNQDDNLFPRFQAGLLKKIGDNKYCIYPSKMIKGTQIYKIKFDNKTRYVKNSTIEINEFAFKKVFFKPVESENHVHYIRKGTDREKSYKLKYALITEISSNPKTGYVEGMLVSSGNLGNRKHFHWIINMPESQDYIEITTDDVKLYKQDESRDEKIDLLKELEKNSDGVPCFYIKTENGEIVIGHTGLFRIPYKYTIGDYVPAELKVEKTIDIAESIFGTVSEEVTFASRVFFEDAFLEPGQTDIYLSEQPLTPRILSNPKPTTFQHYLEQDPNSSPQNLNHWNTQDANIRGHKLYWHRKVSDSDWQFKGDEEAKRKNKKQLTSIKPVKHRVKFHFRIRFENLSEVELGAILVALDLPDGCYHKLGMGKPLGLGSVKITPTLFLIDRERRYHKLFEGDSWRLGTKQVEARKFKEVFEKHILESTSKKEESLWDLERMEQLKTMLDWNNTKLRRWYEETEYMDLNEFEKRLVLPKPIEVKGKLTKLS